MIIEMPKTLNVTLTIEEKDIIRKCYDLLEKIQQEMEDHNCSILEDFSGDICSDGQISDIKIGLEIISEAETMYSG